MRAGGPVPGLPLARQSIKVRSSFPLRVNFCLANNPVYSERTNQVPATWFAGDAGIRRLASLSDGPARGRRRVFTLCGFSETFAQ